MSYLVSTKRSYIDPSQLPEVERTTLLRISRFLRPYARHAALVLVSVCLTAGVSAVPPLVIRRVVDHSIPEGRLPELFLLSALMVVGPLLGGLLGIL